jgi:hypothetical protein
MPSIYFLISGVTRDFCEEISAESSDISSSTSPVLLSTMNAPPLDVEEDDREGSSELTHCIDIVSSSFGSLSSDDSEDEATTGD